MAATILDYLRSGWKTFFYLTVIAWIALLGVAIFVLTHVDPTPDTFFTSWNTWRFLGLIPLCLLLILFNARLINTTDMSLFNQHIFISALGILYLGMVIVYEIFFGLLHGFTWDAHLHSWITAPAVGDPGTTECPETSGTFCRTDEMCHEAPATTFTCVTANIRIEWIVMICATALVAVLQYMMIDRAGALREEITKMSYAPPVPTGYPSYTPVPPMATAASLSGLDDDVDDPVFVHAVLSSAASIAQSHPTFPAPAYRGHVSSSSTSRGMREDG